MFVIMKIVIEVNIGLITGLIGIKNYSNFYSTIYFMFCSFVFF